MLTILKDAGMISDDTSKFIAEVAQACEICARFGPPTVSLNLSISHINEAFNVEIQMYFMYFVIRDKRHVILHFVDSGTALSEAAIAPSQHLDVISRTFETELINRHGAPESVSIDDEFDGTRKRKLGLFLESRNITRRPRPVRRHNKLGIVEI